MCVMCECVWVYEGVRGGQGKEQEVIVGGGGGGGGE